MHTPRGGKTRMRAGDGPGRAVSFGSGGPGSKSGIGSNKDGENGWKDKGKDKDKWSGVGEGNADEDDDGVSVSSYETDHEVFFGDDEEATVPPATATQANLGAQVRAHGRVTNTSQLHGGIPPDESLAGQTITIRQAKDPFVPEPEYIAYSTVTRDDHGWLDLVNPGLKDAREDEYYFVIAEPGKGLKECFSTMGNLMPSCVVKAAIEHAQDTVVTVVTPKDRWDAEDRLHLAKLYERRKQSMEHWVDWACTAVEQWYRGEAPNPTRAEMRWDVPNVPEGGSGAADDDNKHERLTTERPNAVVGSGMIWGGGRLKTE